MTCRHGPGDINCSSHPRNVQDRQDEYASEQERERVANQKLETENLHLRNRQRELDDRTPNPDKYEVEDVEQVGPHLVLKVRYPSCAKCSYEGVKILVILDRVVKDVVRWRRIDPHFQEPMAAMPGSETRTKHAPGPAARFPGSPEGWADALQYARLKTTRGGTGLIEDDLDRPNPYMKDD